ncbi:MAG: hypothetical protein M3N53_00890 [Actinomycetota bacterium]|nr:hypothetical protein [Actinomycetota bacterium]
MTDIERAITHALGSAAEGFVPSDLAAAEERFLRGRRKRRFTWFGAATLTTAAAVVAVAVFPRPELAQNDEPLPVAGPVMTTIRVGESPVSIASTATAVWVANSGDGTISRIDPDTKEVVATVEVGGSPEEVAIDEFSARPTVWVFDAQARRIVEIQPSTNTVGFQYSDEWPEGTHLDLAVKDLTLWMADPATGTVYVDYRGGPAPEHPGYVAYVGPMDVAKRGLLPERGGDVALEDGAGEVWAYNGESGTLTLLQSAAGRFSEAERADITDVLTSENGDLAVGGDALWVSDDFGVIMRIDRRTFEKEYVDVGGRYSNLSYGGGYLWALTANEQDDGTATLRRIDPTTAEVVGEPIPLQDEPVDVSADADAVWVAHRSGGFVTRIDVTPADATPPDDERSGEPQEADALGPDDLVMVFSGQGRRGGELLAMYGDGRIRQITAPIDADLYPSFVDAVYSKGPAVVVERRDLKGLGSRLVYVDVLERDEIELLPGSLPAVSPQGQLAYWRMEKETPTLFVTQIGTDLGRQISLDAAPASVTWDAGGRFVYVVTQEQRPRVVSYDSTTELGTTEVSSDEDRLYLAASSRVPNTVDVISLGRGSVVELGRLTFDSPQPGGYRTLVDLSDLGIVDAEGRVAFDELRLSAMGRLDATVADDGTIDWTTGQEFGWLVGYGRDAWLVKEDGVIVSLGEIANGGVALAPELAQP